MILFENLFCIFTGDRIDIGPVVLVTEATTQGVVMRSLREGETCLLAPQGALGGVMF